jgi:transcriptional regulator with XRE-family HTH domain
MPLTTSTPLTTLFSRNLKHTRLAKKLTQTALADKAGISVSYVSMLEREQRSPPLETIERIATALRIPPTSLLAA